MSATDGIDASKAHRPSELGSSSVFTSPRRQRAVQVQAAAADTTNTEHLIQRRRYEKSSSSSESAALDQQSVAVRLLKVLDAEGLEKLQTTVFKEAPDGSVRTLDQQRAKFLHAAARLVSFRDSSHGLPSSSALMQLTLQLGEIWNKAEVLRVKHTMASDHPPGAPVDADDIEVSWGDFLYFLIAAVKGQLQDARTKESSESEAGSAAVKNIVRTYTPQMQPVFPEILKVDRVFAIPHLGKHGAIGLTDLVTNVLYLYTVSYVGAKRMLSLSRTYTLDDHGGRITCVYHLREQMLLLACTLTQTLCFWDVSEFEGKTEETRRLGGVKLAKKVSLPEIMHCVEYVGKVGPANSSMGQIVLLGGASGDIHMFDVASMNLVRPGRFGGGQDKVHTGGPCQALCSIAALRLAATAGSDGQLILWDLSVSTPVHKRILKGHTKPISSIDFSEHHQLLISVGFDRDVFMWNPYVDTAVSRLPGHIAPIIHTQFAKTTAEILSLSVDGILKVWDVRTLNCTQTIRMIRTAETDKFEASDLVLLDAPQIAHALAVVDGLRVYSTIDSTAVPGVAGKDVTASVLYHELEGAFVTASGCLIRVWNANTGKLLRTFEIEDESPQPTDTSSYAASPAPRRSQQQPLSITCMAFDRHQKQLLTGDIRGRITARLLSGGSPIRYLQGHDGSEVLSITCIERFPGNVVSCSAAGEVRVHQIHNHAMHATVLTLMHPQPRGPPTRVRGRSGPGVRGGKALVAATNKEPATDPPRRRVVTFGGEPSSSDDQSDPAATGGGARVIASTLSVPMGLLATVGSDNSICVWDMKLTSESRTLPLGICHDNIDGQVVSSVTFAGSFPVIVSCNMAGRISIWTVPPSPEPLQLVDSFLNAAVSGEKRSIVAPLRLCYDDESGWLFSGDVDGWVTVWDLASHLQANGVERIRPSLLYSDSLNDAGDSSTESDDSDCDSDGDQDNSGDSANANEDGDEGGNDGNENENLGASTGIAAFLTQTKEQRDVTQHRGKRQIERIRSWRAHEDAISFLQKLQTPSIRMQRLYKSLAGGNAANINGFAVIITGSFNRCISFWNMTGDLLGKLNEKTLELPDDMKSPQNPEVANASVEGPNDYAWKLQYSPFEAHIKADRFKEAERVVLEIRNGSLESLQPALRDFSSEKGSSVLVAGTDRTSAVFQNSGR